jgi:hypothetical protein
MYAVATLQQQDQRHDSRHAVCPTCGKHSRFTFAGEQRWPKRVAEKAGLPEVSSLWHCDTCKTTLSELDLFF